MPQIILAFFGRYWKAIAAVVAIVALAGGSYVKGRRDVSRKMEREVARELQKRIEDVQRERDRTDGIRDSIRNDRESRPIDDDRDSCLLSNDPYTVNCVKGDKK